jgi:ATP-binding cassette subfamily F protein 3
VPLLSLSRIDFDFGRETLLRDVTLDLEAGEKAALVGINGSGKSTLLQIVAGSMTPDSGERHLTRRARIVLLPQETAAEGDETLLEWVQGAHELETVRAQIEALHARLDAGETLLPAEMEAYGDLQHRFEMLGGYSHGATIEATLMGLGFSIDDFGKPIRVLSGGERRRAALAATLLQSGDLVLLDEPTNHLDLDALEWLQGFMQQSPSAMLLVSHDRYFLDHVITTTWHLSNRTVTRWPGNYSAFITARAASVDQQGAMYRRQQDEIKRTEDFIRRNIAGQKTKMAKGRRKLLDRLERIEKPHEEHTKFKLKLRTAKRGGNVVLQARGLGKAYGDRQLFADLDLDLARGDKIGIVGPNGAGKTTLLKILAGKLNADAGTVRLGSDIDLGYFDQELEFVGDSPTLLDEIWRVDRTLNEEQVRANLGAFGFGADYVDRPTRVLSGGQRNRLGLLELMLRQHNFLVMDEPTNHLDLEAVGTVEEALLDFEGTLLVVSHDRQLLSRAVNQLLVVAGGVTRLFHGGYEEYVQSLGGAPLWSMITTLEMQRAERKAQMARAAAPANGGTASAVPEATPAAPKASKNTVAKLRKQVDAVETEIASLEVDLEELEATLSVSHTLRSEEIATASRQHAETKARLAEQYALWDRLSEEIETMKAK